MLICFFIKNEEKISTGKQKALRADALSNGYVENLWLEALFFYGLFPQVQEKIFKPSSLDRMILSLQLDFSILCNSFFTIMNYP